MRSRSPPSSHWAAKSTHFLSGVLIRTKQTDLFQRLGFVFVSDPLSEFFWMRLQGFTTLTFPPAPKGSTVQIRTKNRSFSSCSSFSVVLPPLLWSGTLCTLTTHPIILSKAAVFPETSFPRKILGSGSSWRLVPSQLLCFTLSISREMMDSRGSAPLRHLKPPKKNTSTKTH